MESIQEFVNKEDALAAVDAAAQEDPEEQESPAADGWEDQIREQIPTGEKPAETEAEPVFFIKAEEQ